MCLPDLFPHQGPPQYLTSAVNGVIEECLLHATFEGLPIPEILTDILQHLCIIGEAAVTTAPFPLQHTHCRVFLLPELLPNVVPKPHLRTEGTAPNGSQGVFVVEEVAFNQIIIHPHKNVQLHVQVFEPHSNILGSHSGIKVGMELSP